MQLKFQYLVIVLSIVCGTVVSRRTGGNLKRESRLKTAKSLPHEELMDNLFVIYDPAFMALVWPKIKNGVHLSLDRSCWREMSLFFKDYLDGRAWAYKTADACGRYKSGLFNDGTFWLGSKEQCRKLNSAQSSKEENDTWGEFYSGDYLNSLLHAEESGTNNHQDWHTVVAREELTRRMVDADNVSPYTVAYSAVRLQLNLTKMTIAKTYDILLGLCLPRSCAAEDVVTIISFSVMLNDNLKHNNTLNRNIKISSIRQIQDYDIRNDVPAIVLICFTIILVVLAVAATLVDLDVFKVNNSKSSFDLSKFRTVKTASNCQLKCDNEHVDRPVIVDALMKNINNAGTVRISDAKLKPPLTSGGAGAAAAGGAAAGGATAEGAEHCLRCGKYKKQCAIQRQFEDLAAGPRGKYDTCASLTMEYKKKNGCLKSLLLSFSLKHSWMRIFNTNMANKDLSVLHAVKIISILWIIFVHTVVTVGYISGHSSNISDHNAAYYVLATGTLAFDTMFFVSGVFSAHHFFYLKGRYSVEELVSCGGPCGQALQLICFITNRAIRLLPPYMYATVAAGVLARASRDSATLALPERDHDNCAQYWWRNLLYVNNFYPKEEQCMQVSWYLSLETQLHMAGALLCLLLTTDKRRVVATMVVVCVLATTAVDVVHTYSADGYDISDTFSAYTSIVTPVWSRVAPYCLGVLTGWLVHRVDGYLAITKTSSMYLWVASAGVLGLSAAAPWLEADWVSAALHLSWPTALMWPVVVCATKYAYTYRRILDSKVAAGLSRLCYCALLLHGPVSRFLLLGVDRDLCSHLLCSWFYFTGATAATLVCALLLALLVEMPTCSFLRRLSDLAYR